MLLNIFFLYSHIFAAKLRKYFDMCKFFCIFAAIFGKNDCFMSKLLIIDDERGIRNTLKEILADEGHEVDVAENGKVGLEMAQKKSYDAGDGRDGISCEINGKWKMENGK